MTAAHQPDEASANLWPTAPDHARSREGHGFATDVQVDPATGLVRVQLIGELDALTKPLVADGLASYLAAEAAPAAAGGTVHLDLAGLAFMDTAGLTALSEARVALLERGWRVCLVSPQPQIIRFLDVAIVCGWLPPDVECADAPLWGKTKTARVPRSVRLIGQ
ncbi:MAG: hypothetical protein NVSMB13_10520 [Mycobacteriales bacterium]